MTNTIITFISFLSILLFQVSCSSFEFKSNDELNAPESVFVDGQNQVIYVSNVAGDGLKYDSNGWISKLGIDGSIINGKWSKKGLNAPKGMRIHADTLYVADIKDIVLIDILSGKIRNKVRVKEAIVLNDITIDSSNEILYASDTLGGSIYEMDIETKKVSVLDSGKHLESPNGLFYFDNQLLVGGWGSGTKMNWSTEKPGSLYLLDVKNKTKKVLAKELGHLDGIERDQNDLNIFYITDWVAGSLFKFNMATNKIDLIKKDIPGAADLGILYNGKETQLLIPSMTKNNIILVKP